MNNEFLKYFFTEKLDNILYSLKDSQYMRDKRYSGKEESYKVIDDFFTFVDMTGIKQEDLYLYLKKASFGLSEILIGPEISNHDNKEKYIEKFLPLIKTNESFFKDLMKLCLHSHGYIQDGIKDKNKNIFIYLIDVGLERGFFKTFSEEEKQTQNKDYKQILIDKKVFENNFKIEDLLDLINNPKNQQKILNYFSMYNDDIYNFLKQINEKNIKDLYNKILKVDNIQTTEQENQAKEKVLSIMKNLNDAHENFAQLMSNDTLRTLISNEGSYSSSLSNIIQKKNSLKEYLNNITILEEEKILKHEGYSSGSLVRILNGYNVNSFYIDDETVDVLFKKINSSIFLNKDIKDELIGKFLLNNASKNINSQFFDKYSQCIVNYLSINTKESKYDEILQQFTDLKKYIYINVLEKINNKLKKLTKDDLYKIVKNSPSENKYRLDGVFEKLKSYITKTKDISCLDILNVDPKNPDWKNLEVNYRIQNKHKTENIISYLLNTEDVTKKLIIDWIIDNNSEKFFEIKKGEKDLISYYVNVKKLALKDKRNDDTINYLASKILTNQESYDLILKNNKSKIKQIESLNDEDINKKLYFYDLTKKIENKKTEEKLKTKSNKI